MYRGFGAANTADALIARERAYLVENRAPAMTVVKTPVEAPMTPFQQEIASYKTQLGAETWQKYVAIVEMETEIEKQKRGNMTREEQETFGRGKFMALVSGGTTATNTAANTDYVPPPVLVAASPPSVVAKSSTGLIVGVAAAAAVALMFLKR